MVKRQCESATVQDGGEIGATKPHGSDALLFCGEGKDDLFNYCENDVGSR